MLVHNSSPATRAARCGPRAPRRAPRRWRRRSTPGARPARCACRGVAAQVEFERKICKRFNKLLFQALSPMPFQREFHTVNLHRLTVEAGRAAHRSGECCRRGPAMERGARQSRCAPFSRRPRRRRRRLRRSPRSEPPPQHRAPGSYTRPLSAQPKPLLTQNTP